MIPTFKDLNIGEWKDITRPYHKKVGQSFYELRLKDINKCVGKIQITTYACSVAALFSTESDGIYRSFHSTKKIDELQKTWEELMDQLLIKMFK